MVKRSALNRWFEGSELERGLQSVAVKCEHSDLYRMHGLCSPAVRVFRGKAYCEKHYTEAVSEHKSGMFGAGCGCLGIMAGIGIAVITIPSVPFISTMPLMLGFLIVGLWYMARVDEVIQCPPSRP